jgi:predicted Rossmann fold flavoprotein
VIAIVGAGAAGLATAIFAVRQGVREPVVLIEGARRPGAKILVSGGGRCNVTNAVVSERDFSGSSPHLVKRVLRAFGVEPTVAFFREIGVPLHEEEHGKLFPDANRSRAVLEALLAEADRLGVRLLAGERAQEVVAEGGGFRVRTSKGEHHAKRVVLATGGLSLPKTGSDGHGLELARRFGHAVVPTTPALAPLLLAGAFHAPLSGVALESELTLSGEGGRLLRRRGALLFTHFGISGPVVLDASRDFLRARLEGRSPQLAANLLPGHDFAELEQRLVRLARAAPRTSAERGLGTWLPQAVAEALAEDARCADVALGQLTREARKRLVRGTVERPLPVVDSRGYSFAEATAGGVPLAEVDTATMESRKQKGLWLVGELLDVDGRIGGFNFQWAWSSGWVAAGGLARAL